MKLLKLEKDNVKANILGIIATFHTIGVSILIGFLSFIIGQSGNNSAAASTLTPWRLMFLGAGLILFFLTYASIFSSYDDKKGVIGYKELKTAFFLSLVTLFIFVILLISMMF